MLQEIPKHIKIKGHAVEIVLTGKYDIYSRCKTYDRLNLNFEIDQIEKEKIDLIYEKNYDENLGKRISNAGDEAYQSIMFKLYEELFVKLREIAKSLK